MEHQHLGESPPLVSVIMPNYNCLSYLPRALKSIRLQRVQEIEILVVDDGSDDGSLEWLYQGALEDPALRIFETARAGPAAARNLALQEARGRYVAFLDADDSWLPGKLRAQLDFHESHPDFMFSFTNYQQIDEAGELLGDGFSVWELFRKEAKSAHGFCSMRSPLPSLLMENPVGASTVMARRDMLISCGGFDESLPSAEDLDLWLRMAQEGDVAFSTEETTRYLVRACSESTKLECRIQALRQINQRFVGAAEKLNPQIRSMTKARLAVARAQQYRTEKRYRHALKQHVFALMHAPTRQRFKAVMLDLLNSVPH